MMLGILVSVIFFVTSLILQTRGIFGGDSGDLVTAAVTGGVAHPPGYPLYTFLGWVLSHIPISTPVWRVTILSSLSHAIVLYVVYTLTYKIFHKKVAALFSVFVLFGNYLFYLYSVTPEVFAMLDVGIIVLAYIGYPCVEKFQFKYILFVVATLGVSLTHHPLILFMIPAWIYLAIRKRFDKLVTKKMMWPGLLVFVVGLLPYLYVPIAARGTSMVNWDKATNIPQFIRLITRADYGTFVSGAPDGIGLYQRVLNMRAYVDFFMLDYGYIGLLCLIIGAVWLFRNRQEYFMYWMIAMICLGPGFYFYASFPLAGRFLLGTYERFMLPSYVLASPLVGIGMYVFWMELVYRIRGIRKQSQQQIISLCIYAMFLYPLIMGGITVWRFVGLAQDKTADHFGQDILQSAPDRAIVLLVHDISLFTTQYVRYGANMRPDVVVVHFSRLTYPDYQAVLKQRFPDIVIPPASAKFISEFIEKNSMRRPIVSNAIIPVGNEYSWVMHGMVYLLTGQASKPTDEEFIATNTALWNSYHNPKSGILSRYPHLMLANVLDEYASMSLAYGDALGAKGYIAEAKVQFERAVSYGSDAQTESAYERLGIAQSLLGDCTAAFTSFDKARFHVTIPNNELYKYEAITYRDCVKDASAAAERFSQYEHLKQKSETPLEQL